MRIEDDLRITRALLWLIGMVVLVLLVLRTVGR